MLLATLALAFATPALPAPTALACNPSGPRPQHCSGLPGAQTAPAAHVATARTPRVFCHPDPSKNKGCTRVHPHAEALALRKAAPAAHDAR